MCSFFWNLLCLLGSLRLRYVSLFVLFWLLLIVLIVHKGVSCLYFCMFTFFCFKLICCYPVLNSWSRVNEIPVFSLRSFFFDIQLWGLCLFYFVEAISFSRIDYYEWCWWRCSILSNLSEMHVIEVVGCCSSFVSWSTYFK